MLIRGMFQDAPLPLIYIAVALFGLIVGSFLGCCIYRLPRGKSIVGPRSFCPKCRMPIRWYDNIPLFSYIILLGRCRECARPISARYPIVELLSAVSSVFVYSYFNAWLPYLFYYLLLIAPLIIITFIDIEHRIIPDVITIPGIFIGALSRFLLMHGKCATIGLDVALGIVIGGGSLALIGFAYESIKRREGLGGGDVKLAAMLGAFFGWKGIVFILFVSSVIGSLTGIALVVFYKKDMKYAIPYGPFLAIGAVIYLFFGEAILSWYLGFI